MKINKIEFKNLFAFGEELQTIDYTSNGELILLQGQSGVGKSGLLQLPTLLLYGKLPKIPKQAVANRLNKNGFLRGEVESNGVKYEITRTFLPNSISVKKDGVEINNFGVKDAQEWIDTEIIEVPYITFSNLISISMSKFRSFLTMTPSELKQIVDRVFSLEILNYMFEAIKKDTRSIGQSINAKNAELFSLKSSLETAKNELNKALEAQKASSNAEEIKKNQALVEDYSIKISKCLDLYAATSKKSEKLYEDTKAASTSLSKLEFEISEIKSKISLFNQNKCPTCGTAFEGEHFSSLKEKLSNLLADKNNAIDKIKEAYKKSSDNCNVVKAYLDRIYKETNEMKIKVGALNAKNSSLKAAMESNTSTAAVENIITQTAAKIKEASDELGKLNSGMDDRNVLLSLYSIDGIKQQIINAYLPQLNSEISDGLQRLNFPYKVEFDSKFSPMLTDLGQEIPVTTLSDGERTRVDVVILCALFKLLKKRYPSINILFIDELLSYLDVQNIERLLRYIKDFANDMKLNIYIVSHVEIENEVFNRIMTIYRENGFAKISH